jgi:excisionase family DNA binding protein
MNVAEVAKRLRISRACAYALVESKELGHYRIGVGRGAIRVSEAQLEDYLRRKEVGRPEKLRTTPHEKLKHISP